MATSWLDLEDHLDKISEQELFNTESPRDATAVDRFSELEIQDSEPSGQNAVAETYPGQAIQELLDADLSWQPAVAHAYPGLLGPDISLTEIVAEQRIHTELDRVLLWGFKPRLSEEFAHDDPYTALLASLTAVLITTNSPALDDYTRICQSDALNPDPPHPFETQLPPAAALDRLTAMQRSSGERLFPKCQLGILTWHENDHGGQGFASIDAREHAVWTVWILRYKQRDRHVPTTWYSFHYAGSPQWQHTQYMPARMLEEPEEQPQGRDYYAEDFAEVIHNLRTTDDTDFSLHDLLMSEYEPPLQDEPMLTLPDD